MKKILVAVLACVLLLTALPAMAADNVRTSGLYTYKIKGNGTITITDFDWENNTSDVFIPNMIDGYTVTGIDAEAFSFTSVLLEVNSSWSVTLPEGIKHIGEKAFWNANISAINIPQSVQIIGPGAFVGNSRFLQFKISGGHPYFAVIDGMLYNKASKELIAYGYNGTGNDVDIPEGIISIADYTFYGMQLDANYPDFSFPSTLTSIGAHCFERASIRSFDYWFLQRTTLKTIGDYAFAHADFNGYDFYLPATLETIGEHAFEQFSCTGNHFIYIYLPDDLKLTCIPDYAFFTTEKNPQGYPLVIVKCTNPAVIQEIGQYAGCGEIFTTKDSFSSQITNIPTGLNPATNALPDTVISIESGAFTDVVTDFRLSSTLNDIAVDAFPKGSTFIVDAGSYAELWCSENGFGYSIEGQQDDLSWLN